MSVSREEVERIARLARLHLAPAEAERLTGELNRILERVAVLGEVDVSGVDGIGVAAPGPTPERPDAGPADALALLPAELAPAFREGFFVVPRLPGLDRDRDAGE